MPLIPVHMSTEIDRHFDRILRSGVTIPGDSSPIDFLGDVATPLTSQVSVVADSVVSFFFPSALAADPSRSGSLPVYEGDDLIIDASEADKILDFFFGIGRPRIERIGDLDRSFAQALYIEGLDRTQQVGWIGDLFRSKVSIPKLGARLGRRFLKGDEGQINVSVQRVLTDRFEEEYLIRVYTGQYPSYGRNQ